MSDVLTRAQVFAAVELLRANNVSAPDGYYYVLRVHPDRLGYVHGTRMLFTWEENTAKRWAEEEKASRLDPTPRA